MGPTASGKSSLAMRLAEDFNGEIISADSMQLYRGLDIGTAKPSPEEQARVKHHLIDILDISEKVDVFRFIELASAAIDDIISRGKLPVIAGGTGMYLKALLYGIDPLPGDAVLRTELDRKYDNPEGFVELKKLMAVIDPDDYSRWHDHQRKLIRALEVFKLTGKSISELQTLNKPRLRYPAVCWTLVWERETLKRRIRERTAEMLKNGWIEEAENMLECGILNSPTAHQVLGYRIIRDFIDNKISLDDAENRIATATWQLARRQITWFKRQHPDSTEVVMPQEYSVLKALMSRELCL